MNKSRYDLAIEKNLDELQRAMLIRTTIKGIETAGNIEFFFLKLVYNSLLNDYLAKCIKVFEDSNRAASFWYIFRSNEKAVNEIVKKQKIDLTELTKITLKLKYLRDKAHFHLDTEGVLDTQMVWRNADISEIELQRCVFSAQIILHELAVKLSLKYETMPATYNTIIPYRVACAINSGNW
jgi:hypothetical protein